MSVLSSTLTGMCPHCGKASLFDGLLHVRESCLQCGTSFASYNTDDGPAFLVITFGGFLIIGLVVWVEFTFSPPVWVHMVVWPFSATGICLYLLRLAKAAMIAVQLRHAAPAPTPVDVKDPL